MENTIARDIYSETFRRLQDNPASVAAHGSTVTLTTLLGHTETWVVKVIRVDGRDTALLQRIDATGGMRLVLPPEVVNAMARQRDGISGVQRRRAAKRGAETRKEKGIVPGFLKKRK
jgi:hypothetical protein